eukprot:GHVT01094615.1.p2 GENE.GHVT01094615.1~~GHVT01094615.1.p2  ORF type:complete len:139 (-),score=23.36 GHVT01094615.1:26-442(-)
MYFFSNSPVKCLLTNVVLPTPPSPTRISLNSGAAAPPAMSVIANTRQGKPIDDAQLRVGTAANSTRVRRTENNRDAGRGARKKRQVEDGDANDGGRKARARRTGGQGIRTLSKATVACGPKWLDSQEKQKRKTPGRSS